jgi:flagellar hook-basal body complex protein FliE
MPITSVASTASLPSSTAPAPASPSPASGAFSDSLQSLLGKVDSTESDANSAVANMLDGTGDVHDAMIALQNADMALQFTVQVRNKIVQAYQDIMRMPV